MTVISGNRSSNKRSRTFVQEIIDCAPDGILMTDHHNRIYSFNDAIEKMFDVKLTALRGTSIKQLFSGACAHWVQRELERAWQKEPEVQRGLFGQGRKLIAHRHSNSDFPIHMRSRRVCDQGEYFIVSYIRDISSQVNVETEFQRQNAHLRATIDYSPVGITMINERFEILEANLAFAKMLGYSVDEIIGKRFAEFTHPDDIDVTEGAAHKNFHKGLNHYTIEKRYIHKNGRTVYAALSIGLIRDALGKPQFAIANIEDLTHRRAAQAQLKEQQNQLNHLERLSVLGEMSAGIAHEIDQPLTAISTYAQSALRFISSDNPRPERAAQALENLSHEAQRVGAVVKRIRNLSRRDPGKKTLLDCSELIDDVEELVCSDALSSRINIRMELSRQLPNVVGDPIQIQQVVLNLIRNAFDASRNSPDLAAREVTVRTAEKSNGDVLIAVADQGAGVDPAIAQDLFSPFSTDKETGMGLGLSISQTIVAAHGGQLAYRNGRYGGATFYFTLPPAQEENTHE